MCDSTFCGIEWFDGWLFKFSDTFLQNHLKNSVVAEAGQFPSSVILPKLLRIVNLLEQKGFFFHIRMR